MIQNCPLNLEVSVKSNHIYGPAIPLLQGGMKRQINPDKKVTRVPLPTDILLHRNNIELYFECFIQMKCLSSIKSHPRSLSSQQKIVFQSADNIIKQLNTVNKMYKERGFNIDVIHGDNKLNLNYFREHIRTENLSIYAKRQHIHIFERSI